MSLSALVACMPARSRSLLRVGAVFLAINLVLRLVLLFVEGDMANLLPARLAGILGVGLLFDLLALGCLLLPFALLALCWGNGRIARLGHGLSATLLFAAMLFGSLFTAASEVMFWNEFSTRFNFIAVDYLIYTREVFGNIRESYPLASILASLAVGEALILVLSLRRYWRAVAGDAGALRGRFATLALVALVPAVLAALPLQPLRGLLSSASARDLAGNGYVEFVRAFRNNQLDYRSFYRTLPDAVVRDVLADERIGQAGSPGPPKTALAPGARNLVLVSMESLGADYVASFGGRAGLTPNLDRLAQGGMMFTQMYATGLRTVRGLEALTLSVPPTPGHAVPTRPRNKGLPTLGGVLASRGYEPLYLYGGYSYFDNMRDFFAGNGYTVIDRTAIDATRISHETIWGVADEDLFAQAIDEIDRRAEQGKLVFAHIMTTSNHRPFTYPDGRINIASGSGREGAVEYSDWAIGRFIEQAKSRPWFDDTVFVFVADHTSNGRGRTDLPPENYRIPMIVYSPAHIAPTRVDTLASQIDVAPTVLALLGLSYPSRFFGHDILAEGRSNPRAFLANYLTVGYLQDGLVVELSPQQAVHVRDAHSGSEIAPDDPRIDKLLTRAIAYYQSASDALALASTEPLAPLAQQHARPVN